MKSTSSMLSGRGLILVLLVTFGLANANASELVEAAKKQQWDSISSLLNQSIDVNLAQADGTTALAWTAYWDDLKTAKLLIKANADVNAGNYIGVTPLILATRNRSSEMVSALLNAGADPNKAIWSGETALMNAAKTGVTEIVMLLLDNGADINAREPRRGQSALMWAISFGHADTARVLIELKADVSARTIKLVESESFTPMLMKGYGGNVEGIAQGGYTPLMFAAREGDMATVRLLLEHGAEINDVSAEDGPALVIASAQGFEKMAMALLEAGANPNIPDANGMTALHYTMRDGLKRLLGFVDISAARVCGFEWDTLCKYIETITDEERAGLDNPSTGLYIVEGETDSNEYERENRMILPGGNMYDLAETLLARGAEVNAAMKYAPARIRLENVTWLNLAGATPFFLATAALDNSAMEMLMEHGANPLIKTEVNADIFMDQTKVIADDNQVLGNGSTLMVAVGLGKKDDFTQEEEKKALTAAKRLLELGANVNETTATGWTPLHAAAYIGANSLVEFLVDKGASLDAQNGCGRTPLSLAEAENSVGLIKRISARESTVNLLQNLGATKTTTAKPVGECVLGRFQF
ncbi:MAG: ankyrin repeat domain-containing protein [Gammaproteobacteria bacterium]|jgi:ankyrin repeat protein